MIDHRSAWIAAAAAVLVLAMFWSALEVSGLRSEVRAFAQVNANLAGSDLLTTWASGGMDRQVRTARGLLEDREAWCDRHRVAVAAATALFPRDR